MESLFLRSPFPEGILSAVVWPTYVGAVRSNGEEPMSDPDYKRGSIAWRTEGDEIVGSATILVPPGDWSWIIYCYDDHKPRFVSSQKLDQTLRVAGAGGDITLQRITQADFKLTNQALRTEGMQLEE